MMRKIDAWMPVYPGDYLADTGRLTTEQHGAYFLLLLDYWRCGSPPADDAILANITRLKKARWQQVKLAILPFFKVVDGRLVHARVEAELASATGNQERRSDKARKAAKARWEGGDDDAPSIAPSNAKSNAPECPPPSPTLSKDKGAAAPPVDQAKVIFTDGLRLLVDAGDRPASARSFLGKLRKEHGDGKVAQQVGEALRQNVSEPKPWLVAALAHQANSQNELIASIGRTYGKEAAQ